MNTPSQAQTLDEQYEFLLSARCANLGFERDLAFNVLPGQAGPNLSEFCSGLSVDPDPGPGGSITTSSTGGGAGAAAGRDGGANEDAALRRRREELRGEQGSATTASGAGIDILSTANVGIFLSFDNQRERQEQTRYETGRGSKRSGAALGMDYRLGSSAVLGLAFNTMDQYGASIGVRREF